MKRRYRIRAWEPNDAPIFDFLVVNERPVRKELIPTRSNAIVIERVQDGMIARAPLNWVREAGAIANSDEWARSAWKLIEERARRCDQILRKAARP